MDREDIEQLMRRLDRVIHCGPTGVVFPPEGPPHEESNLFNAMEGLDNI